MSDSLTRWKKYKHVLEKWFYEPSFDTIQCSIASYVNHVLGQDRPVWLFALGGPSTGKTSTVIKPLSYLPDTYTISTMNEKSLISGFGKTPSGLLFNMKNKSGIILFSDFSNFLSLPDHVREQVQSQLRDVYDGEMTRSLANFKNPVTWKGRCTIIAACTNELEQKWKFSHDLGERFMNVQMTQSQDMNGLLMKSISHSGQSEQINKEIKEAILQYVDVESLSDNDIEVTSGFLQKINQLSVVTAYLRQLVKRDQYGNVLDLGEMESPTRIHECQIGLTRAMLSLNRKRIASRFEARHLKHLCKSTIKTKRIKVLEYLWHVFLSTTDYIPTSLIASELEIARSSTKKVCEDLAELNYLDIKKTSSTCEVRIKNNSKAKALSVLFDSWQID